MKLENMDATLNRVCESITPDVNLMSEEFNFCPISEAGKENGDGMELKENPESDETHRGNGREVIKDALIDGNDAKKPKQKDKRTSKIPIRRVKKGSEQWDVFRYESVVSKFQATDEPDVIDYKNVNMDLGDGCDNLDNMRGDLGVVHADESSNATRLAERELEFDKLTLLEGFNRDKNLDGIQTTIMEQEESEHYETNKELSTVGKANTSSLSLLIPREGLEREDFEIPILEAPEEFRCLSKEVGVCDKQVDIGEPEERHNELPYRDHDNTYTAETGDTSRRTEEDGVGNAPPAAEDNNTEILTPPAADRKLEDNNNEWNNGIVTAGHVGSCHTAPSDTSPMYVDDGTEARDSPIEAMDVGTPPEKCENFAGSVREQCVRRNVIPGSPDSKSSCYDDACRCRCADQSRSPSIEIGVAKCAQASGCSRVSTAKVCVALKSDPPNLKSSCANIHKNQKNSSTCTAISSKLPPTLSPIPQSSDAKRVNESENTTCNHHSSTSDDERSFKHLSWKFNKDGRLVFEETKEEASDVPHETNKVLWSKDLNKRIDDSRSRLKYLEQKLKEAGITDDDDREQLVKPKSFATDKHKSNNFKILEQVVDKLASQPNKKQECDANQNILKDLTNLEEILPETSDEVDFQKCEFDVRQVGTFSGFNNYWEVYDELDSCDEQDHLTVTKRKHNMGIDGERAKHNPDRDNLKSLLKRPGRAKDKRTNRVVFNENKNEFFDADYIILIREECDYDDEDDDSVCTCNQHEMVRLTCCEPNCNCTVYDGFEQTPQSPKFAPPLEFVDAVTLSPPEGYKDLELEEQQLLALQQIARRGQRTAVCRECSVSHEDVVEEEAEGPQSDNEPCAETHSDHEDQEEKEKTDQSQQTTPTTPPNDSDNSSNQNYILETITMTTVTEQRILREAEEDRKSASNANLVPGGSPINGILKGGKLWKQQSLDGNTNKAPETQQIVDSSVASDEENGSRRSVRFIESEQNKRDSCDGASDNNSTEENKTEENLSIEQTKQNENVNSNSVSPESTEMMLTFKLGNHVLISNNSLKPNSAVRQLFPCTKQLNSKGDDESIHQYLVTAESLRAFEEAKRSKLPQIIQSGETDESIKRAIERNTLRRSLIRYEPRSKKTQQKTDNSLVERIKQLTCDVDDDNTINIPPRTSPPGEEARNSPEVNHSSRNPDKSFSPSSSSTTSSNSSSMSSTYKKITDLFGKRDKMSESQNNLTNDPKLAPPSSLPDLGNGASHIHEINEANHTSVSKVNSTNESRKQFLSTLAPLTACVSGLGHAEEYYYHINNHIGERASMASSVGTEYSLEDIDEGLKNGEEDSKKIAPDVLAGTPSASESGDELAIFVQQDASRIERIKKKYQPEPPSNKDDEDDEHDDYGFNRRPSVRGIKPRFGSTTEILQQIQNQLQPPAPAPRVAWPYYSESGLTGVDNLKSRNINQNVPNYQYPNVPEEIKTRNLGTQFRPTSLQDENIYQNCANQRCARDLYRANGNSTYSTVVNPGGCPEIYQTYSRPRVGRPHSPPPLELSKTFHQTMVYIPYNHIEGYQQTPYYPSSDYVRVSNQNQINKRYIEPIYQQRIPTAHIDEHHYVSNVLAPMPLKPMVRIPMSQPHLLNSRSESPVSSQFSTARSTQTPLATTSSCNFYVGNPRYRPMVGPAWPNDCNYVSKMNRHSFPASVPRYPPADSISLTDSDSQHSGQIPNGFRPPLDSFSTQKDSAPSSPIKPRFLERGVPEGAAASIPSQDTSLSSSSTMTSPTSPQNPPHTNQKPLFYAMNV